MKAILVKVALVEIMLVYSISDSCIILNIICTRQHIKFYVAILILDEFGVQ